ncbi:MAG: 50S ribosomal protein L18 [Elusimicrobia bacterium]|nr:50S ribosomal protein L18 [Elusimicrobiota bacterium]
MMKRDSRLIRKWRVAKKIRGTGKKPRLAVSTTLRHAYAQLIDDTSGRTLAFASTLSKELSSLEQTGNKQAAAAVGLLLAKKAAGKKIDQAVFDRGRRRYHGRVQALAESAREGGIKF